MPTTISMQSSSTVASPSASSTLQRDMATLGYFSAERLARHTGETSDEIAMNPAFSDFTPSGINVLAPHFHAATGAPRQPLPRHP